MTLRVLTPADVERVTTRDIAARVGCGARGAASIIRALIHASSDFDDLGVTADKLSIGRDIFEAWLAGMATIEPIRGKHRRRYAGSAYFITDGDAVKIGETDKVNRRLEDLQACNPRPLQLLACFRGGAATEAYFHGRFREYCIHSEWFRVEGELAKFIAGFRNRRKVA